jgi:hypothetical protein
MAGSTLSARMAEKGGRPRIASSGLGWRLLMVGEMLAGLRPSQAHIDDEL